MRKRPKCMETQGDFAKWHDLPLATRSGCAGLQAKRLCYVVAVPEPHRGVPNASWAEALEQIGGGVLQSSGWARFQQRLGHTVLYEHGQRWCWMGVLRQRRPVTYLYVPYGPAADEADAGEALGSAVDAARSVGCDFVRVEPTFHHDAALRTLGAHRTAATQPEVSWRLDITPGEPELRRGLTKGHKAGIDGSKRGLTVAESGDPDDVEAFLRLLHLTEARSRFRPHPDAYFRTMLRELMPLGLAHLYFATSEGSRIAGAIAFDFGNTRYYAHAGADTTARKLSPGTAVVWRMLIDARQAGKHWFDFWGITESSDPAHPWAGITQFKRSFGGEVVRRVGTWEIPLRTWRYRLYAGARKMRR